MKFYTERELEEGLQDDAELARPSGWESAIAKPLAEHRARTEAAAMAPDFIAGLPDVTKPGRIAGELRRRARFLRSKRGGLRTKRSELQIIEELEAIAAQARELDAAQRLGVSGLSAQRAALGVNVFTVRLRYADLLEGQDLPFTIRAQPPRAEERKRELAAIEAFLAGRGQDEAA
jgi:hypothetical protein